jgi:hypothetical protein
METIVCLGLIYFTLNGIYSLIKFFAFLRYERSIPQSNDVVCKEKVFILIPVLNETERIETFYNSLADQKVDRKNAIVVFITSVREKEVGLNSTSIMLDSLIKNTPLCAEIIRLHCLEEEGNKSTQLKFAESQLVDKYGEGVYDNFFLILDVDQILKKDHVQTFIASIAKGFDVYIRPSLWFSNYHQLSSILMKSFSLQQSYFSVSYESHMFIGNFFRWRLKYFVGHSLLFSGKFLKGVGGFPEIAEDVQFGRLASFLDYKVFIVRGFNCTETVKSLSILYKQSAVWFVVCGQFFRDYFFIKKNKQFKIQDVLILLYGVFKFLRWLLKGFFHLFTMIYLTFNFNTVLVLLLLSSLILNAIIPTYYGFYLYKMYFENSHLLGIKKILVILVSPVQYMISFPGLFYGIFILIKNTVWPTKILYKTER